MAERTLVANVTEAGDIVLYALVLVILLVVGLALLGIDTLVGRLHRRGRHDPSDGSAHRGEGRI
ncbi:MAG TPA: hypothetical protein VM942_09835 [Acidimicrobiales bacterium]|nr:hypothetical protein [Acidimicrobiales bacterium]